MSNYKFYISSMSVSIVSLLEQFTLIMQLILLTVSTTLTLIGIIKNIYNKIKNKQNIIDDVKKGEDAVKDFVEEFNKKIEEIKENKKGDK